MNITITLPETFTVPMPHKTGSIEVESGRLPPAILADLIRFALKQKVANATTTNPDSADIVKANSQAMLESFYAGQWSARGETDEVAALALTLAKAAVTKSDKAKGVERTTKELTLAAKAVLAGPHGPALMAKAEALTAMDIEV